MEIPMIAKRVWLYGLLALGAPAAAETIPLELSGEDGEVLLRGAFDDSVFAGDGPSTVELPVASGETRRFELIRRRRFATELVPDGRAFRQSRREAVLLRGESSDGWTLRGIYGQGQLGISLSDGTTTRYVSTPDANPSRYFDVLSRIQSRSVEEIAAATPGLPPGSDVKSPTDPTTGKVVLRHVGTFLTITESLWKTIDPQSSGGNSVAVNNFVIGLAGWLDDAMIANANVTITAIGNGLGANGDLQYIYAPNAGYAGQPANSVFGNVAFNRQAWSTANDAFQEWVMASNGGLAWWDAGMVLALDGLDPSGGTTVTNAVCTGSRGDSYYAIKPAALAAALANAQWSVPGFYVAHEFGHLLGAGHTFTSKNGICAAQLDPSADFEIGAGRTFMGYYDQCAPDNDPKGALTVFHGASLDQINARLSFVENGGAPQVPANCIGRVTTANSPVQLSIAAPASPRWIPKNAGFTLTAYAIDPDPYAENKSSYFAAPSGYTGCGSSLGIGQWNQMDSSSAGAMPPLFRSATTRCRQMFGGYTIPPPSTTINKHFSRFFPPAGNGDPFDVGASVVGTMHFRATVWDINADAGSGVPSHATADVSLTVKPELAPTFTAPTAASFVKAGQPFTVKWTPTPSTLATPSFWQLRAAICSDALGKCYRMKTLYGAPGSTNAMDVTIPSVLGGKTAYVVVTYEVDGVLSWHAFSSSFQVQP